MFVLRASRTELIRNDFIDFFGNLRRTETAFTRCWFRIRNSFPRAYSFLRTAAINRIVTDNLNGVRWGWTEWFDSHKIALISEYISGFDSIRFWKRFNQTVRIILPNIKSLRKPYKSWLSTWLNIPLSFPSWLAKSLFSFTKQLDFSERASRGKPSCFSPFQACPESLLIYQTIGFLWKDVKRESPLAYPLPGLPKVSSHLPNNRIFLKGPQASEILIPDIRIVVRIGNNSQGSPLAYPLPGLPRVSSHLPKDWIFLKGRQEGSPLAYSLPDLLRFSFHLPNNRIFLKGPQEGSPLAYPLPGLPRVSSHLPNNRIFLKGRQEGSPLAYPLPDLLRFSFHLPNNRIFLKGPQEGSPLAYPFPGLPRDPSHLPNNWIFLKGPQEALLPTPFRACQEILLIFQFTFRKPQVSEPCLFGYANHKSDSVQSPNFSRHIIEKVVNPQ